MPPAFPATQSPVSTLLQGPRHPDKSHALEAKGTDKQDKLLRQRETSGSSVRLQREALRRKGPAMLFEERWEVGVMVWTPGQRPELQDSLTRTCTPRQSN